MLYLFLYFYFGQLTTSNFDELSGYMFGSNWKNLPVNLQKYLILMIENTSEPIRYDGFGIIILNLETFTKVRHIIMKRQWKIYKFFK